MLADAEPLQQKRIFVSYSSADSVAIDQIALYLDSEGVSLSLAR